MVLKLHFIHDGPPSSTVRMVLKYLNIEHELVYVDMGKDENRSPAYLKLNPLGLIPVMECDENFVLYESVAMSQYLADKYKKDETFYPTCIKKRGIINQLMAFHLSTLYPAVLDYFLVPLYWGNKEKTEPRLQKVTKAFTGFEGILEKQNTKFVAGDDVTIADVALSSSVLATECDDKFNLSLYPRVKKWYEEYKKTEMWNSGSGKECLEALRAVPTPQN